jgi:hypothetical protein
MLRHKLPRPDPIKDAIEREMEDDLLLREDDMSPRALMARLTLQAERRIDAAFSKTPKDPK